MIEAVENHMPETIIIDEMGTEQEAAAARTIAERGVQLIATAHGNTLAPPPPRRRAFPRASTPGLARRSAPSEPPPASANPHRWLDLLAICFRPFPRN